MEDLIKALQIFLKYGNPRNPTNCSHDEMAIMDIHKSQVSEADVLELDRLGFIWDEAEEYFLSFRYGSA